MVKYKLLISEPHAILRAGLRALLGGEPDIEVVGDVAGGSTTLPAVAELMPDLVMMDFSVTEPGSGDGTDEMQMIRESYPATQILVLTQRNSESAIRAALRAGAGGYILKTATDAELVSAVRNVLVGNVYLSPDVSSHIINAFLHADRPSRNATLLGVLTNREVDILQRVAAGHTNRLIAEQLSLSIKTVEKHRSNLMRKLDLHNASALTTFAIGHGLISPGES